MQDQKATETRRTPDAPAALPAPGAGPTATPPKTGAAIVPKPAPITTPPEAEPTAPKGGYHWLRFLRRNGLLLVMLGGLLATAIWALTGHRLQAADILHFSPRDPWLAALICLLLFAAKGLTAALPYNVLVIAVGLLYPLPVALALNLTGTVICVLIPYFTGRFSKESLVDQLLHKNKRLRQWYETQKGYTFFFSVFLRALGLSNELLGLFFGSLGAGLPSYFFSSMLAILPNMLFLTVLGHHLEDPFHPATLALCAVMVCMAVGVIAAYFWQRKRDARRKAADAAKTSVDS